MTLATASLLQRSARHRLGTNPLRKQNNMRPQSAGNLTGGRKTESSSDTMHVSEELFRLYVNSWGRAIYKKTVGAVHDKQGRSSAGREALYLLCANSQSRTASSL